jgi:hydrogenase nickel incorporation protein HypB
MTTIDARQRILQDNEAAAARLRARFERTGTLAINLISSPGSGKTALLEATARRLAGRVRMAAVVGDVATELDAERLRAAGLRAEQIVTQGACHLDARMVDGALAGAGFGEVDLFLIENVGNLVCPTSYDLGERFKVALCSVTEGADKPFKYPGIFAKAAVTLITKSDLLPHVRFDLAAVEGQVRALNPDAEVLLCSAHDGTGLDAWCALLERRIAACKACATSG